MASAFQRTAFQFGAFQMEALGDFPVTDTDVLQKPINCVLAGQQRMFDRVNEWIVNDKRTTLKRVGSHSAVGKLSRGPAPSFTVKTNNRGYD